METSKLLGGRTGQLEIILLAQSALNPYPQCFTPNCMNIAELQVDFFPQGFDFKNPTTHKGSWGRMFCVECAQELVPTLLEHPYPKISKTGNPLPLAPPRLYSIYDITCARCHYECKDKEINFLCPMFTVKV